ncbi:hypothetical protein [Roseibium sp. M-1]
MIVFVPLRRAERSLQEPCQVKIVDPVIKQTTPPAMLMGFYVWFLEQDLSFLPFCGEHALTLMGPPSVSHLSPLSKNKKAALKDGLFVFGCGSAQPP